MRRLVPGLMAVVLTSGLVSPHVRASEQRQAASQAKEPTVHAIVTDPTMPSTIYVGTNDGLALSDDGGKTWTLRPFSPPEHVYALALDPRDHSTLWAERSATCVAATIADRPGRP